MQPVVVCWWWSSTSDWLRSTACPCSLDHTLCQGGCLDIPILQCMHMAVFTDRRRRGRKGRGHAQWKCCWYLYICIHTHMHTVDVHFKPLITKVASCHILHVFWMTRPLLSLHAHVNYNIYVYMMTASGSTMTPTEHSWMPQQWWCTVCSYIEHYNYCTIYYLLHDCALKQYGSITLYQWNHCIAYCIMNSSCSYHLIYAPFHHYRSNWTQTRVNSYISALSI